jgi:hypothetical protein
MIKVHYIHEWKCHDETFCYVQLTYANKKNVSKIQIVKLLLGNHAIHFIFAF